MQEDTEPVVIDILSVDKSPTGARLRVKAVDDEEMEVTVSNTSSRDLTVRLDGLAGQETQELPQGRALVFCHEMPHRRSKELMVSVQAEGITLGSASIAMHNQRLRCETGIEGRTWINRFKHHSNFHPQPHRPPER